jgi:hypothetical protein
VRALLEERVAAVPVAEVVVLPGFPGRDGTGGDRFAVDEDFDGPDVAGEVPGVGACPGQGVRRDLLSLA